MGLSDSTLKMLVFLLVFSIVFPVASYAMQFNVEVSTGEIAYEDLMSAGIIVDAADTQNITQQLGIGLKTFTYYDLNQSGQYRVHWGDVDNVFEFQIPNPWLGWWWPIVIDTVAEADVISGYDTDYNWTHIEIAVDTGSAATSLYTIYPGYNFTMAQSIAYGNVTLTIGRGFQDTGADLMGIANWYFMLVTGQDTTGLPTFFVWLIQITGVLGLIAAVLLIKEFIPLLP